MALSAFYVVEDAKAQKSTITIEIPAATSPTNAYAFVRAMAPLVGALVTGRLVNAGITLSVPLATITGWPSSASSVSDVQEKARFSFRTAANFLKSLTIPTILETVMSPGTKFVNQANTDVAAFITAMEDGVSVASFGGSGTVQPCDIHGEDLEEITEAREAWGKYRK